MKDSVYYSDYLQLHKILNAQDLESDKPGRRHAHDEMLFITIHQSYELWFKQILYEVDSVMGILAQPNIHDNSPDMFIVNHRLKRVVTIFQVLIDMITILETMTPLDFLDFRNMLRPASGFQSIQFKLLEAYLGLRMDNRHAREYYLSQLRPEDVQTIKDAEKKKPLIELVNDWLERTPFFERKEYWGEAPKTAAEHPFWKKYLEVYSESLVDIERVNLERFKELLLSDEKKPADGGELSPRARRAALFIMMYRDYPLFQMPFELLNNLLEIDEGMATWRYRHMHMVHRMIGMRTGTGGSTGKAYLSGALERHYIFGEIAELTSFLVEKSKLPELPQWLQMRLGFDN